MTRYQREEIDTISQRLLSHTDTLISQMFSGRKITCLPNEYRIGNKGSLVICRNGSKAGCWYSFEDDERGNIIKLVQYVHGFSFCEAMSWCQDFLGNPMLAEKPRMNPRPRSTQKSMDEQAKRRMEKAQKIWRSSQKIGGTLAEQYLQSRHIEVFPETLRFHPRLQYARNPLWYFPALVCAVQSAEKQITAVHAVYLDKDTARKATLPQKYPVKLSMGVVKGSAVRLNGNAEKTVICEGVEDGLSILQALPSFHVCCTLGTANFTSVPIPKETKKIVVAADNDEPGRKAAYGAAERLTERGYYASVAFPSQGKDFNEMLCKAAEE